MKKILTMILVFSLSLTLISGCSGTKDVDIIDESNKATNVSDGEKTELGVTDDTITADELQILNWSIGADPKTLDPALNATSDGADIINQTFEGLTREKSGVVYPGIAKSWETSEDGLTVTFYLRESKWSDGSDLTAHDFVYSWKRAMNPETASGYSYVWEYTNIVGAAEAVAGGSLDEVGIKALDDYTLEIKLNNPTDYIFSFVSHFHFMPVKQSSVEDGEEGAWAKDPDSAISNGPFVLKEYEIGEGLELVKNENYWNADNIKLNIIKGVFITEESTAYQAYQTGELDIIPSVPVAETAKLLAEDPNFYVFPLLATYYYNFNMDLDIWSDVRVRKALSLAIDREMITETLGAGQVPAAGFVPPGFVDADGNDFFETSGTYGVATDDSKISEAQTLLAEAGYPNGEGFPKFTMLFNTSESHQMVAELIQEMLKTNLGIECKLQNQEWAVFLDTRQTGNYELARGGFGTDFMDPLGLLGLFATDNDYNDPNYYNDEYDALLNTAVSTMGEEHFEALYEAQEMLMNDMPIIPIYHYVDTWLVSENLVGWDRSVRGAIDFTGAYLSE